MKRIIFFLNLIPRHKIIRFEKVNDRAIGEHLITSEALVSTILVLIINYWFILKGRRLWRKGLRLQILCFWKRVVSFSFDFIYFFMCSRLHLNCFFFFFKNIFIFFNVSQILLKFLASRKSLKL